MIQFYWIAAAFGAVIVPLIAMPETIQNGFWKGPLQGFAVWAGLALFTAPGMLTTAWLARRLVIG